MSEARLAEMRADAVVLRKLLGDPLHTGPLSKEELQMLRALSYLK